MFFLDAVAKKIRDNYDNFGEFAIIFPNSRSKLYFTKLYSNLINKPQKLNLFLWQDFLNNLLQLQPASKLEQIFLLYNVYKQVFEKNKDFQISINEFYFLAEVILSDFNEINNYLIDHKKIFFNLADLENISEHTYLTQKQIEAIKRFWGSYKHKEYSEFLIELFFKLSEIFEKFNKQLLDKGLGYSGLRNKMIVDKLKSGDNLLKHWDTLIFVGFYALTESELEIMNFAKKHLNTLFFWEYDKFYMQDKSHEASFFINKNLTKLGEEKIQGIDNLLKDTEIELIEVSKYVAQAKILPWALKKLDLDKKNTDLSKTAIVLLDENLLFPVLYSLPDYIDKVNITLQFPFSLTPLYSFFKKWLRIIRQLFVAKNIYYKDFQILLKTEIIQKYFSDFLNSFKQKYLHKPSLVINYNYLKKITGSNILFTEVKSANDIIEIALKLLYRIYRNADDFEREYIYHAYVNLNELKKELLEFGQDYEPQIVASLIESIFSSIRVPFEGHSLNALQIITIMETRNLDFDNIVILGANEGIYPPIERSQSFFTESIRAAYNLPILKYQDSLYSFFFYSLIQRAKKVLIVYNSVSDEKVAGKTRYVLQLEKETDLIKKVHIFTENLSLPLTRKANEELHLEIGINKFSASALITYLTCPRRFFYQYVVKLLPPEQEDILEISVSQFGSLVHRAVELFYYDLFKKYQIISPDNLKQARKNVDTYLNMAWDETNVNLFKNKGYFSVVYDVMKTYLLNVIDYDINYAPFEIVSLEKSKGYYTNTITVNNKLVQLYGIIDRIDKKENLVRLIDYKTGKKEIKNIKLENLFNNIKQPEVFQLLFYKMLVDKKFQDSKVVPILYSLSVMSKNLHNYSGYLKIDKVDVSFENIDYLDNVIMPTYSKFLKDLINKILFEDKSFTPVYPNPACEYCPYIGFCK